MKNRARRILALLLVAVMALGLAACGKSGGDSGKPGQTEQEQHPEFAYVAEYKTILKDQENSYSPRAYTDDGFYAISWEKIGSEIPEGVTPEYEGQYDVYGSFIYFVDFSGKAEKLPNYQRVEPPANDQGLKDFSSGCDINGFTVTNDGRLVSIENIYTSWSEAPEGMTQNDNDYWNYNQYKQEYYIRWMEKDGTEISRAQIQMDQDMYLDAYRMYVDTEGNVVTICNGTQIWAIAPDGTVSYRIESSDYFDCLVQLADNQLGVSVYGETGQELVLLDVANKKLSDKRYTISAGLYDAIPGSNGYDLYYTSGSNFYGLKLEEGTTEKLFNWINCDVNSNNLNGVSVRSDGSIVGISTEWDSKTQKTSMDLVTVKQVPYDSVPHKETITLGCLYLDYNVQEQVVKFNRANDKYRIEVKDYSEYNMVAEASTEGKTVDVNPGLTKFNTEIMAGNVPDIIDINSLNYVQLASKGIIEDLYPYIDADPELNRDDFFANVLGAMEVDGKLCTTVPGFYINAVMGASSVVGDTPGWTYEEFDAALASMPEGCQPFDQYVTRDSILQNCLALDMDEFVNWGTGECRFDSQQFIDLLNFAARFPETFDWENYDYSNEESTTSRIAQGKQMLVQTSVYQIEDLFYNQYIESFGGNVTFIGYPTASGTGNMLGIEGNGFAMSSKSQYKDVVWDFLRIFMTKDYQEQSVWSLASRKDIFDEKAQEAMTVQYQKDEDGNEILDEEGNKIPIARYSRWNEATGESEEVYAIEPEQIDQLRELIASTDKKANYDSAIFDIVNEQAAAFFQGQKSAGEVAKLIQSKANIFVNEQR